MPCKKCSQSKQACFVLAGICSEGPVCFSVDLGAEAMLLPKGAGTWASCLVFSSRVCCGKLAVEMSLYQETKPWPEAAEAEVQVSSHRHCCRQREI